ncbi:hypothetical protein Tco_1037411, partial [Tanacetum coccineum]
LREMREEMLVRSRLSSVWFNKECDPVFRRVDDNAEMSIYDFMTLPSWSDAKIVEESHHLSMPLLELVSSHITVPATKGAIIPLPTPNEIAASLPDSLLVKNSKAGFSAPKLDQAEGTDEADLANLCAEIEDSLKRDEGVFMRVVSSPTPRLGKRLGAPPSIAIVSASEPSHVGTSAPASTSGRSLSLGGVVASGRVGKSGAEDPDVCMKALDRTITLAELRRTKYLLPLELSNCVNVLSAMLVSHGCELNSRYANLVSSRGRLQEKLDQKKGDVRLLRLEVTSLDDKLEKLQGDYDALGQENRELYSQRDATFEDVKKLQSQLTDAKAASAALIEELTRTDAKLSKQALTKLLSSDEFHASLARVASLGLNYCVDRGLCMGRTDIEFEAAVQNKIVAASGGTLSDLAQILPNKFVRSATSVSVAPSSVNEAPGQVPP